MKDFLDRAAGAILGVIFLLVGVGFLVWIVLNILGVFV